MRTILFVSLFAMMLALLPSPEKRVVFLGDSITEFGQYPNGYIDLLNTHIARNGLGKDYVLMGAGVSGNKVYDLLLRLESDVLSKKPTDVVILIGINDVWHRNTRGTGTDPDKFAQFYKAIIQQLKAAGIQVHLCTPTLIGELKNKANPLDLELEETSAQIRQLAQQYNCTLIDLREAFQQYLTTHNTRNQTSGVLTTDEVHLNDQGNQLLAQQIQKVLFTIRN